MAGTRYLPVTEEEAQHRDSDEDSLSSSSSSSDICSVGPSRYQPNQKQIRYLVSNVYEQVRSLYKISALLRRPTIHEKYIRSVAKDDEVSYYMSWDQAHVENKFPQADGILVRRLALANTRRRQQLKYWEKHHDEPATVPVPQIVQHAPKAFLKSQPTSSVNMEKRPATENTRQSSLGLPSALTMESLTTVAQSELDDNATLSSRPRTIYEPSTVGGRRSLRVPEIPKVPFGSTSFDCPYCFARLDVQSMRKRQLWK